MRFFAPQKIIFDEMSNGLVLDILKFYTAQIDVNILKQGVNNYFKNERLKTQELKNE